MPNPSSVVHGVVPGSNTPHWGNVNSITARGDYRVRPLCIVEWSVQDNALSWQTYTYSGRSVMSKHNLVRMDEPEDYQGEGRL
jgi:hypothetical protein